MFHKQTDLLWRMRNLFTIDEEFFENIFFGFLPESNREVSVGQLNDGIDNFVNFLVYRLMVNSEDFLYADKRLYMYTMFELFRHPFEMITFFQNDCNYMAGVFNIKFAERRLYLLDSLDNLALKSLNVFKEKESLEEVAKHKETDADLHERRNQKLTPGEEGFGLTHENPHVPQETEVIHQQKTYHDEFGEVQEVPAEGVANFRMINQCIKGSAFKSQSLEKLYCFHLCRDTPADDYILSDPKFNRLLQRVFFDNSQTHAEKFISLKATYFTEQSIYDDQIYPEFMEIFEKAKDDFETKYSELRHKFFEDSFNSVRRNLYYLWRKVVLYFMSKTVFKAGVSSNTLFKNIVNFDKFAHDLWLNKDDNEYFKLEEFNDMFRTSFNENLEKFSRFT